MMLTIVPYEDRHWAGIEWVHDAAREQELAYAKLDEAFLPLEIAAQREDLFDYQLYVGQIEDTVAGFVAFTEDELAWLYVHPDWQRRGIGRALANFALGHMESGEKSVEVLCGNEPARQLYHSLGFVNEKVVHGRMPGNEEFRVSVWQMTME